MIPDIDNNETHDSSDRPEVPSNSPEQLNPAQQPDEIHHADEEDERELVEDELFDNEFDEDFDDSAPLADDYASEDEFDEDEEDADGEPGEEDSDDDEEYGDEPLDDAEAMAEAVVEDADDILAPDQLGVEERGASLEEILTGSSTAPKPAIPGTLLFVGTPIGNKDDITYRGHRTLQNADIVVCEEYKVGARLLRDFNISKKLIEMNEHNEEEASEEIIGLLRQGKKVAVISDAGLPLIADPGSILMRKILALGVQPVVIPGVSSIMTALMMSGFDLRTFDYVGFLPRKPEERQSAIHDLASRPRTLVLLETPYRLRSLLAGLVAEMPDRQATLAVNLTTPFEAVVRGTLAEIAGRFSERKFKGEFVMVLAPTFTRTARTAPAAPAREQVDVSNEEETIGGGYAPVRARPARDREEHQARPAKFGRREFGERGGREPGEIHRSSGRGERPERGERPAWGERPERGGRPGRGERPGHGERPRFEGRGGSERPRFEGRSGSERPRFEGRGGGGGSRFEGRGGGGGSRFEGRGGSERPRFERGGGTERPSRGDWTPRRPSGGDSGRERRGNDEFRGSGFRGGDGPRGEGRGSRGPGSGFGGRGSTGGRGPGHGGSGRGGSGHGGSGHGGSGRGSSGWGGSRGGSNKGGRRPR